MYALLKDQSEHNEKVAVLQTELHEESLKCKYLVEATTTEEECILTKRLVFEAQQDIIEKFKCDYQKAFHQSDLYVQQSRLNNELSKVSKEGINCFGYFR